LYQDKLRSHFLNLKEGESVTFDLEHYQYWGGMNNETICMWN
jgi:hypothetical protein